MSELREQLEAAMAGSDAAPVVDAVPVVETPAADPAPETAVAVAESPADTGAQPRDESGKFAPKAKTEAPVAAAPAEAAPPVVSPEAPEPEAQAIRVPPSLPAAVKAKFGTLDPDVREAFAKLEDSVQTAKSEWGKKGERLNAYDEIIAPHRDAWAVQGLDDRQALQRLVAAEKVLRETPAQGILYLAQSYGVNLQTLVGQVATGAQPQPQAAVEEHPALAALMTELQTLKNDVAQQRQAETDTRMAAARSQVEQFAADPANLYFENVRGIVSKLIETGEANDLKSAYEMAIWASPEIRPLLQQQQEAAQAKRVKEEAERAKAAAAKAAGGSVTGSPTSGAAPANPGPRASLREELLGVTQELGAAL